MSWMRYIKDFVSFLKIEKGLAENSIFAYQNDVEKLKDFAEANKLEVDQIALHHLNAFIKELYELGLSARTQARILSGVKQFFRFLLLEGELKKDPSELLEMPKIGKKLPEVMTIEEVDTLLATIDLSTPEGHRNKAMLETLYSCGLRVSELVNLKYEDIFFSGTKS